MKKFLFLAIFIATNAHARRIVLDIPDQDIAVVENDVIDAEQWIKDAWAGKVSKCQDRIIKAEIDRSLQGGESLPTGRAGIIGKAMKRSDYKSRKQRDAALGSATKKAR